MPTYWPIVPNVVAAAPLSTILVHRSSASAVTSMTSSPCSVA